MEEIIDKKLLRKLMLDYRRMLSSTEYKARNQQLCDHVSQFISDRNLHTIHTFLPIKRNVEPDITSIFRDLWKEEKVLVVSKTNFETRHMEHFLLREDTPLKANKLGIQEPINAEAIALDHIDLIFVPLVVADKQGNRIGYGGGFYDQMLKETNALKVGLSLSTPVDKIYFKDEWDVPLNFLITPFKTYQHG